ILLYRIAITNAFKFNKIKIIKNIKHHANTLNKNTVTLKDNKNHNKKQINQLSHAIIKHHIDYAPCITNSCM
uniref:hypothetical protein n=1 Tax=Escherichia coli TaxID=562 RepID=UPI001FCA9521